MAVETWSGLFSQEDSCMMNEMDSNGCSSCSLPVLKLLLYVALQLMQLMEARQHGLLEFEIASKGIAGGKVTGRYIWLPFHTSPCVQHM